MGGEKQAAVTSQWSPGLNWADVSPEREENGKPHARKGVSGWLGHFPGSPVLKTPLRFHCRGRGFHPWLGNWDSHVPRSMA